MRIIDNVNNTHIKNLAKLKIKKYKDQEKKFLIEGFHLIEMALNKIEEVLVCNLEDVPNGISDDKISLVNYEIIKKLSDNKTPQPIIGVCSFFENFELKGDKFLLLDNVSDPGNLGGLIRSALAFNIDCIVISPDACSIYNDKVIRSSQGAIFKIPIITGDINIYLERLKSYNVTTFGTSLINGTSLNEVMKTFKFALVLGNEGVGVKKAILDKTDMNIYIPISDKIDSLNVLVAGSIIMNYLNE